MAAEVSALAASQALGGTYAALLNEGGRGGAGTDVDLGPDRQQTFFQREVLSETWPLTRWFDQLHRLRFSRSVVASVLDISSLSGHVSVLVAASLGLAPFLAACSVDDSIPETSLTVQTSNAETGWWMWTDRDVSEVEDTTGEIAPRRPMDVREVDYVYVTVEGYQHEQLVAADPDWVREGVEYLSGGTEGVFGPNFNDQGTVFVEADLVRLENGGELVAHDEEAAYFGYLRLLASEVRRQVYGEEQPPDDRILVIQWGLWMPLGFVGGLGYADTGTVHLMNQWIGVKPIVEHELGHVLGNGHTPLVPLRYDSNVAGAVLQSELSEGLEYGDPSHILGIGEPGRDIFAGFQLARMGLLSESRVQVFDQLSEEPVTTTVSALLTDGVPRLIKIPVSEESSESADTFYYIELSEISVFNEETLEFEQSNLSVRVYVAEDFDTTRVWSLRAHALNLSGQPQTESRFNNRDFGAGAASVGTTIFADLRPESDGFVIQLDELDEAAGVATLTFYRDPGLVDAGS